MYITMIKVTVTVTPRKIHCSLPLGSRSSSKHSHSKLKSKNAKKGQGQNILPSGGEACIFYVCLPEFNYLVFSSRLRHLHVHPFLGEGNWWHCAIPQCSPMLHCKMPPNGRHYTTVYTVHSGLWHILGNEQLVFKLGTLPPIIMEMENGLIVEETASSWVGTHYPLSIGWARWFHLLQSWVLRSLSTNK